MHFVCLIMFGNSEFRKFCGQISSTDEIFRLSYLLIDYCTDSAWNADDHSTLYIKYTHIQYLKWSFSKGTLFAPHEFNCVQTQICKHIASKLVVSYLHDILSPSLPLSRFFSRQVILNATDNIALGLMENHESDRL